MPDTYAFDINGTVAIPDPTVGQAYSHQLPGEIGDTFAVESGSFPTGLSLSSSGLISGTPTVAGSSPPVRVARSHAVAAIPINVNAAPPPPPPPGQFTLTLVGGWRINQPYCYGGLAIDFATMRAWTCGNRSDNQRGLFGYQLPAMGSGQSIESWPQVNPAWNYGAPYSSLSGPAWYTYATGLLWQNNELWISGRQYYAQWPYPDTTIKKFTLSGATATLVDTVTIPRPAQHFGGGFIKGGSEVLPGCGGYESGHNSVSGPCWMKMDGTIVNSFPIFNAPKEEREKRPDNYSCGTGDDWFVNPDPPVGYMIAGRIVGGGFIANGTTCFVIRHGTGALAYANQGDYFSVTGVDTHLYKYAPGAHFGTYEPFTHGLATGFEVQGNRVYMLIDQKWGDSCPAIYCFEIE